MRDGAERRINVKETYALRRFLKSRGLGLQFQNQVLIEFIFKSDEFLLGIRYQRFLLLKFRQGVAFAVCRGLLSDVFLGHHRHVRLGDLDEISENFVVTDLKRLDAGSLTLGLLEVGDPVLSRDRDVAEFVE